MILFFDNIGPTLYCSLKPPYQNQLNLSSKLSSNSLPYTCTRRYFGCLKKVRFDNSKTYLGHALRLRLPSLSFRKYQDIMNPSPLFVILLNLHRSTICKNFSLCIILTSQNQRGNLIRTVFDGVCNVYVGSTAMILNTRLAYRAEVFAKRIRGETGATRTSRKVHLIHIWWWLELKNKFGNKVLRFSQQLLIKRKYWKYPW